MNRILFNIILFLTALLVSCEENGGNKNDNRWPVTVQCVSKDAPHIVLSEWTGECAEGWRVDLAYLKTMDEDTDGKVLPGLDGYLFGSIDPVSITVKGPSTITALYIPTKEVPGNKKYDITLHYCASEDVDGEPLREDIVLSQLGTGIVIDREYLEVYGHLYGFQGRYFTRLVPGNIRVGEDSPQEVSLAYEKTVYTIHHLNKYTGDALGEPDVLVGVKNIGDQVNSYDYVREIDGFIQDYNSTRETRVSENPEESRMDIIYQNAKSTLTVHYRKYEQRDLPPEEQDVLAEPETFEVEVGSWLDGKDYSKIVGSYTRYRTCEPYSIWTSDDPAKNVFYIYMSQ